MRKARWLLRSPGNEMARIIAALRAQESLDNLARVRAERLKLHPRWKRTARAAGRASPIWGTGPRSKESRRVLAET